MRLGLIDNWVQHIKDVKGKHREILTGIEDSDTKQDTLCELNVIEQVLNVCNTTIVQDAWTRNQPLSVHGWIYGINDGALRDLKTTIDNANEIKTVYANAIQGF